MVISDAVGAEGWVTPSHEPERGSCVPRPPARWGYACVRDASVSNWNGRVPSGTPVQPGYREVRG